jgi:CheY-like chemotaxis protein
VVWLVVWAASSEVLIGLRVFVVDDELNLLRMMERFLKRAGFSVTTMHIEEKVTTMQEVLGQLDLKAFDIIISDVDMKQFTGFQLVAELRQVETKEQAEKPMPIILCSGDVLDEYGEKKVADLGVNRFVKKPFNPQELIEIINELVSPPTDGEPAA